MTTPTRTQAERRAATIDALLDATIDSLAEVGFVATTTRGVAERAGVSQGAQQHYFPTKAKLVDAAIYRLMQQLAAEAAQRGMADADERTRAEELLEQLWKLHNLPITPAVLELFNVARTDPRLAKRVAEMTADGMATIQAVAEAALPTYAKHAEFAECLQIAVATIRGTVILTAVPGGESSCPTWNVIKRQLMANLDSLLESPRDRKQA